MFQTPGPYHKAKCVIHLKGIAVSDHLPISAGRCSDSKSERIRINTKHQGKVWTAHNPRVGSAMCLNTVGKVSPDENKI